MTAARYRLTMAADAATPAFRSASGCRVTDDAGRELIDFIGGYGVVNTGWQRPEVLAAVIEQAQRGCFAPPWMPTREAADLAEWLLKRLPWLAKCGRASGGAEANEVAVKALFAARGGTLLVVGRAYHGGTTRTLALSDGSAFGLPPTPVPAAKQVPPAYCFRCPWGKTYPDCSFECAEAVEAAIEPTTTGVLLEPVLASGGAVVPPAGYFAAVADICRRRGLVLILDEVVTGCGRLGAFTASELFDLRPDAVTLAKGLAGGYAPIGAAVLSAELAGALMKHEDVSATLAWTPLACAAALANLRLLEAEGLAANAAAMGPKLVAGLREVFGQRLPAHLGEVRGLGLLAGVELVGGPRLAKRIALRCYHGGLMVGSSWDWRTLVFLPPLTLDDATLDAGLAVLDAALAKEARP